MCDRVIKKLGEIGIVTKTLTQLYSCDFGYEISVGFPHQYSIYSKGGNSLVYCLHSVSVNISKQIIIRTKSPVCKKVKHFEKITVKHMIARFIQVE